MPHPARLDNESFKAKARAVHGLRYGYSQVSYVNSHTPVVLVCPIHGRFLQAPYSHLNGRGCPECSGRKRSTTASFVAAAAKLHKGRYSYEQTHYVNSKTKVKIRCPVHGVFEQVPNSHLSGRGCVQCAKTGYDRSKAGFLYLLLSECGRYAKVGITNRPRQRFSELRTSTPFHFVVIENYELDGGSAAVIERWLHRNKPSAALSGFGGATEWLHHSLELEDEIACIIKQFKAA